MDQSQASFAAIAQQREWSAASIARKQEVMVSSESAASSNLGDKVVIQYGDHVMKGYTNRQAWDTDWCNRSSHLSPPIWLVNSEAAHEVPLDGIKAVFFVHTFEGKMHEDLRFHDHREPMDYLWVRVVFRDEEVIEGMIPNSQDFLTQDGFLLYPIDPESNNWMMYLCKQQIRSFAVLGLRSAISVVSSQAGPTFPGR